MKSLKTVVFAPLLCITLCGAVLAAPTTDKKSATERNVIFISTSDSHYREVPAQGINERDRDTVRAINALTDISWPDELGGDRVQAPRAVMMLGDVIDDGDKAKDGVNLSEKQYANFIEDFGFDGTDKLLKYPVFETWGNHDGYPAGKSKNGFSLQEKLKERNKLRKEKGLISNISDAGVHYSWDWDDVHFVSLGIYPADKQRDGIRYSSEWHNPQGALTFLKQDLEKNVGKSGRPVVMMAHMGFDTDWWVKEDWADFYNAAKDYNVALYMYGHSGTGAQKWSPAGETKKWQLINDGQTENGFFVIQFKGDELRFGQRVKVRKEIKPTTPEGKPTSMWTGEWKWAWTDKIDLKTGKSLLKR